MTSGKLISKQEVIEDVKKTGEKVDKPYRTRHYKEYGKYSLNTVLKHFPSWVYAKLRAGITDEIYLVLSPDKNHIAIDIDRVNEQVEGSVTAEQYREKGVYKLYSVRKVFGSWNNAKQYIGLETQQTVKSINPDDYDKEEVLNDIRKAFNKVNGKLTSGDYREEGNYTFGVITRLFGSWKKAKKLAGVYIGLTPAEIEIKELFDKGYSKEEVIEKTDYSHRTVINSLNNLYEDLEDCFDEWVDALEKFKGYGWFKAKTVKKFIDKESNTIRHFPLRVEKAKKFIEYADEVSDLSLGYTRKSSSSVIYIGRGDGEYSNVKKKIPERFHVLIDEAVEKGMSPSGIGATVKYFLEGTKFGGVYSQKMVAEEFGCTDTTIRNNLNRFLDRLEELDC